MWHNQVADPPKFWLTLGPGHAATFDAMLDLFPGDPVREELIAAMADWVLHQIANVPGPEGRAALQGAIAQHPRMAELALKYRWSPRSRRLRASWRRFAVIAPSRNGLVDVWPFHRKRPIETETRPAQLRGSDADVQPDAPRIDSSTQGPS
jgi:hypothetical protein